MSSPYTAVSISNFNANPPSNDGQKVEDNRLDWDTQVVGKVGTPLKTAIEQINTNLTSAFAKVFGGAAIVKTSASYVIQPADQSKTIVYQGTGSHTHTTPDATAVGTPFWFLFINAGTAETTIDGSGAQTINGANTITLGPNEGAIFVTDAANWFCSWVKVDNPARADGQTFGGSVADGDVVYWNSGSAYWDRAQANTAANQAAGIADVTNSIVYFAGLLPDSLLTGLTPGATQYLDDSTPGALTETAPTTERIRIGYATTATRFVVQIELEEFKGREILIETQTASDDATLDFVTGIDSTYDDYVIKLDAVLPATDDAELRMRVSDDGGSTFEAGASFYQFAFLGRTPGASVEPDSSGEAYIRLTSTSAGYGIGTAAGEPGLNGKIEFSSPDVARQHMFRIKIEYVRAGGPILFLTGAGRESGGNAINGIRFLMNTGNIASGTISLYGIKK